MKKLSDWNSKNWLVAGVILVAGLALTTSGCNKGEDGEASSGGDGAKSFAYVTNGVDPFWTIAEAGATKAAEDLDVEVTVLMPAGGSTEQRSMLQDLMTRGTDGIAVSPIDAENQASFLNEVAERSILITHDSDAPLSNREVFIGVNNYTAGRMCGQLVKEALPDGGTVMIFVGRMEQDNARLRRQGVIDELMDRSEDPERFDPPGKPIEGEKYTILGTLTEQFDRSKAKANAEDTLARNPDIGAMVGLFAYNTPMILEAIRGREGEVKIASFDEDVVTLQAIKDGKVHGTVVQNPYMYGYKSVEVLNQLAAGDKSVIPEDKFINVPARQIRKDNVEEFWADLNSKLGKE